MHIPMRQAENMYILMEKAVRNIHMNIVVPVRAETAERKP